VRIFYFSTGWTIVLCFVLWIVINLSAAYICLYLPDKVLNPNSFFFRSHPFEMMVKSMKMYSKSKGWKQLLPEWWSVVEKRGYKKASPGLSEETWNASWLKLAAVS